MPKYSAVEFSDKMVEIVASNWPTEDNSLVYWPPFKHSNKFNRAVINCSDPQPSWEKYAIVRVMGSTGKYNYYY